MTSQINPDNIDGTYPIAGQDNSSQGFRTNFTNTKNNFTFAADEISDLQAKVILKQNLTGVTTPLTTVNNMDGSPIVNAAISGFRDIIYDIGEITGSETIDCDNGSYQTVSLTGSMTIGAITNWPTTGVRASLRLSVVVPNTGYTLTLPAEVTKNYTSLANINSRTITFTEIGTYDFIFVTEDGGTTISVIDVYRNRNIVQGNLSLQTVIANSSVNGITMTVTNIAGVAVGNITATNIIANNLVNLGGTNNSVTGNVTAGNLIANTAIYGTLATNTQPNITLLGTLTSLSVSGNANVGNLTVTNFTDMCGGTGYGVQFVNATSGSSTTIDSNTGVLIIEGASTLASYTVIMPSSPMNGQAVKLAFGQTVTSLTHTVSGGQTIKGALTTAGNSGGGEWVYYTSTSTWYRVS